MRFGILAGQDPARKTEIFDGAGRRRAGTVAAGGEA
jgi:hypothetical protein